MAGLALRDVGRHCRDETSPIGMHRLIGISFPREDRTLALSTETTSDV
jgi:hypothetical protein